MSQLNQSEQHSQVIRVLCQIAADLGRTSVSSNIFFRRSGISKYKVQRLFGSYTGLVEAAGLVPRTFAQRGRRGFSDQEIIAEMARVLRIPHSKLSMGFFQRHSQMSAWTCASRFGTWRQALKAAADQLDPERDRVLVSRIRVYAVAPDGFSDADTPAPRGTRALPHTAAEQSPESLVKQTPAEQADVPAEGAAVPVADVAVPAGEADVPVEHTRLYGEPISFRSLEHAPVNELGVVFLFGMIARDLGYVVEMLNSGFPDCEAKRQVKPGIWQRVRIEFEFRSRSFSKHGHDPYQCDVIVCWENNWPDCPIEVQELKSVLPQLPRWR